MVETTKLAQGTKQPSLAERVAQKAKSRSFNPVFLDGKAMLFDINNYGVDYTAGGQLAARWVANDDARISIMRTQGYMFPDEWDPELPRKTFGGLTLMLREQSAAQHRRNVVAQLAAAQDARRGVIPDNINKPWQQGGAQGVIESIDSGPKQSKVSYTKAPITPD